MAAVVAIVTAHAAARALERIPELAERRDVRKQVARDVVSALDARRMSKRCPVWVRRQWFEGKPSQAYHRDGVARFVWDAEERRCYVIVRAHRRDDLARRVPAGAVGWLVVTTLVAGMGEVSDVTVRRPAAISRR